MGSFIAARASLGNPGSVRLRCLIVDDNEAFLASASRLLESQGADVVGCATSSAEAMSLTAALSPSVVLVDVQLGDEDGLELARRLSAQPAAPPVVLISTRSADEVLELLDDSPAIGFLAKKALGADGLLQLLDHRAPR
jgi:two-component system nitrate/nitrite response regulator NarL